MTDPAATSSGFSTRHRIWDVIEIVDNITSFLPQASLVQALITCRDFHISARSHLYRSVTAANILSLIRATLFNTRSQASTLEKWERFQMYAKAVRRLDVPLSSFVRIVSGGAPVDFAVLFRAASDMFPVDGLLPGLRALWVHVSSISDLRPILPLLRAPLQSLSLRWAASGTAPNFASGDDLALLWSAALSIPPSLRLLQFIGHWPNQTHQVWAPLRHPRIFPDRLERYGSANCPATVGLLKHLSCLQYLRLLTLRLDPGATSAGDSPTTYSFPVLSRLHVYGDAQPVFTFLSRTSAPIEIVEVTTTLHPDSLSRLSELISSSTIRQVNFTLDFANTAAANSGADLWKGFDPLLECNGVSGFSIQLRNDHTYQRDTNRFVQALARAWPNLTVLHVEHMGQGHILHPDTSALTCLATHCRSLDSVKLGSLEIGPILPAPLAGIGHSRPIILSFGLSNIEKPAMLAAFLSTLWPRATVSREGKWTLVNETLEALRWQRGVLSRPAVLSSSSGKSMDDISREIEMG